jgi:hypothetical protein
MSISWISIAAALSLLFLTGTAHADATPSLDEVSASQILKDIRRRGAVVVVRELKAHSKWEGVLDKIETGECSWLETARRLRPGTDASAALELRFAVSRALSKNPKGVLRLVGKGFSIDEVCTSPFIEPDPGVEEAFLEEAMRSLKNMAPGTLTKRSKECLTRLKNLTTN